MSVTDDLEWDETHTPFRLQSAQTLLSGCLSNSRRARVFASVVFLS